MWWIRNSVLFIVCSFLFYPKVPIVRPKRFGNFATAPLWPENPVLSLLHSFDLYLKCNSFAENQYSVNYLLLFKIFEKGSTI